MSPSVSIAPWISSNRLCLRRQSTTSLVRFGWIVQQARSCATKTPRLRRLSAAVPFPSMNLDFTIENTSPEDPDDPYRNIRIFRKDMLSDSSNSRSAFPLSVDLSPKKFIDLFSDFDAKRCKLCNETYLQWHSHTGTIPHSGRESIMLELVRAYCGTPEEIVKMWWYRLNNSSNFNRIKSLSHDDSHIRKRRLQYLLQFLKDKNIIHDTFNVVQGGANASAGRSWEFERLEWIGDNVVKYVFNDRLNTIFPVSEGGIRGKLGLAQFVIDGNDGLARAYDYLELQKLTLSDRVVSKFKSDVVETLFGELQLYLWSTEVDIGTEYFALPFSQDMITIRALVNHVMDELAHCMFMYHVEYVLAALQRIIRENQLQCVRSDPSLRGQNELQQEVTNSWYARRSTNAQVARNSTLSPTKTHPKNVGNSASLFYESTNYENFKRIVPLGGLLPVPFSSSALSVTPSYMPHLQEDKKLTPRIRGFTEPTISRQMILKGSHKKSSDEPDSSGEGLSDTPLISPLTHTLLDTDRLKDEGLIDELI